MDLLQQVLTSVRTSACPVVDPELLLQSAKHHAEQRSHASAPPQRLPAMSAPPQRLPTMSAPPQLPPAMSISPSTNEMPDNDAPSHQNQSALPDNVTAPLQALEHAANEQPASDTPASGPVSDRLAGPARIVAHEEDVAENPLNGDSSELSSDEDSRKQAEPDREAAPSNKRKVQGGQRNTRAVKKAKTTRKPTGKGK